MTAAQKTERRGNRRLGDDIRNFAATIATCVAAAMIALAAPAHADVGKTVCALGNGMTHAQENCPQAAGRHLQALATYGGYLLPQGFGGKA